MVPRWEGSWPEGQIKQGQGRGLIRLGAVSQPQDGAASHNSCPRDPLCLPAAPQESVLFPLIPTAALRHPAEFWSGTQGHFTRTGACAGPSGRLGGADPGCSARPSVGRCPSTDRWVGRDVGEAQSKNQRAEDVLRAPRGEMTPRDTPPPHPRPPEKVRGDQR